MRHIKKEKVLFLENVNQAAIDLFTDAGFSDIEVCKTALPEEELLEKIKNVAVLGVRSRTWLKPELFAKAKKLTAVGCFIVGVNKVDLAAARQAGVPVFHGPFSSTRSVAELTIGFIFALFRKTQEKNLGAHQGKWLKKVDGREVRGKTLGLIGFSNIGSQVGLMAEAIGMNVIYYDVANVLPLGNAKAVDSLDELYAKADVISLHIPSLPSTRGMIDKRAIAKMKKSAMIINTSRGDIINEQDLADALQNGDLAGAAVDVYTQEPKSPSEPLVSPLIECSNALLTPHIGGSTREAQSGIGQEVAKKLIAYLETGKTADAINFPKLFLPSKEKANRVLHIHQNVPGMLAEINNIFASEKINIASQYLNTEKDVGYVATDIEGQFTTSLHQKLSSIPQTIKCLIIS